MNIPETLFTIIENAYCPLYADGDRIRVAGRVIAFPAGKAACMTLVDDMKEALKMCESPDGGFLQNCPVCRFNCSGKTTACSGVIRLEYRMGKAAEPDKTDPEKDEKLRTLISVLARFPIFEQLDENQLRSLGAFLKFKHAEQGEVLLKKGEPGVNLYILASGKVAVLGDDGMHITTLEKGEVFGEMSLISGEAVGASVKVLEPAKLLYIKGRDFGQILVRYPSVQMYFARLLTKRLAQSNVARTREFASGMTGKLSDIPPAELFQSLNINQKTGAVELDFAGGRARVCFRGGELVRAVFNGKSGTDAFYEILKQTDGRFTFSPDLAPDEEKSGALGDFMWLLMEGVRKIDEARGR